ncbi:MAG: AsmA family protein, partial [Gammaproteobacteria bacterium]|nr:AsmA family protein [Gammaproteobacteria bacterium]
MKKRLIGTAVAALLLIAGLSVYVALLDVNQYKDQLTELVEASTGRALSISGDIRLKLSLVPTVAVDGVTFGNAAWAAHENMITVERF